MYKTNKYLKKLFYDYRYLCHYAFSKRHKKSYNKESKFLQYIQIIRTVGIYQLPNDESVHVDIALVSAIIDAAVHDIGLVYGKMITSWFHHSVYGRNFENRKLLDLTTWSHKSRFCRICGDVQFPHKKNGTCFVCCGNMYELNNKFIQRFVNRIYEDEKTINIPFYTDDVVYDDDLSGVFWKSTETH